uniref:Beta-ketoacyl-[acyl-carrier-protein] synthase I n=1 Tax=Panagrolaimus sp. PS1159 TaxID=55785 RepID=A0AC35GWB5_9BILA
MAPHRVVITGIGVISPFGVGGQAFWNGLRTGKNPLAFNEALKAVIGAVPKEIDPCLNYSPGQLREMSRGSIFAVVAATEALEKAGLHEMGETFHESTSVNIGMGIADLESISETGEKCKNGNERKISPYFVPRILTNIPASYVSLKFKLRGGNSSTTTACATGASSICEAFQAIRYGNTRRAVAGAVESCLSSIAVEGFKRMRALATSQDNTVSRPFDSKREGFVLSEGAGILVLERLEDALQRNCKIYAEILGFGMGNDAYHLTSPREDGYGSGLCMKRCIEDSKIDSKQIEYVNAHATSTPVGDKAEAISIAAFKRGMPVSSIKGHTGHCLAAAGALETIATALSVRDGIIIGTKNLKETDISADIEFISAKNSPTIEWKSDDRQIALMNSFGFGGAFVSLCLAEFRH